ncbi:hypothetical protein F5Y12DRAFT_715115 [Xylaria sp. FL1777]|nr:hypothetical protein F5Y12DRAFT_715115 [Xylaria sp. FL1777]
MLPQQVAPIGSYLATPHDNDDRVSATFAQPTHNQTSQGIVIAHITGSTPQGTSGYSGFQFHTKDPRFIGGTQLVIYKRTAMENLSRPGACVPSTGFGHKFQYRFLFVRHYSVLLFSYQGSPWKDTEMLGDTSDGLSIAWRACARSPETVSAADVLAQLVPPFLTNMYMFFRRSIALGIMTLSLIALDPHWFEVRWPFAGTPTVHIVPTNRKPPQDILT